MSHQQPFSTKRWCTLSTSAITTTALFITQRNQSGKISGSSKTIQSVPALCSLLGTLHLWYADAEAGELSLRVRPICIGTTNAELVMGARGAGDSSSLILTPFILPQTTYKREKYRFETLIHISIAKKTSHSTRQSAKNTHLKIHLAAPEMQSQTQSSDLVNRSSPAKPGQPRWVSNALRYAAVRFLAYIPRSSSRACIYACFENPEPNFNPGWLIVLVLLLDWILDNICRLVTINRNHQPL
ncbi:hypothetical protein Pst134EA_026651 [Puccinia striiformis f. sp. tritici]|uniref:hypothetical protein n=1 Tax=Puccinia striiformis f. sp. tritici TaxID=168172 RepID=UPI00200753BD|nr:hypothetical protein Pst134EA_026651 [Puccinia striiformis f. sp. tritici]KAH9449939.1 hypothetical protein Pst134EA_026651 [Puccinia striiformis f. sp. tritici]